ncbi:hypothetical protein KQI89_04620 [Clostridium sp. MSJ-4]|uniref:DUF1310 family protein n=1 Tax=Clostridium simiarum TaxID=2841506 RepID=A0ABS6F084_9CLOT|nr:MULTISPECIES: hypothetical protein [Clostridium]MBU5591038.1 hypothetical protein [Clostridium simiarum]
MKYKTKCKLIITLCILLVIVGFVKINIQCNKTKEEAIKNMEINEKLYKDGVIKEEYSKLYTIVDNSPIKIFYDKNPLDIKIMFRKFDIVINKEVFKSSMDSVMGTLRKVKINPKEN